MRSPEETQHILCERLKKLGYAREKRIRLYGEDLRLVSNPVPDGDGFAVDALTRQATVKRLRIPLPVVHVLKRELVVEETVQAA